MVFLLLILFKQYFVEVSIMSNWWLFKSVYYVQSNQLNLSAIYYVVRFATNRLTGDIDLKMLYQKC